MPTTIIRYAAPQDMTALAEVSSICFLETYTDVEEAENNLAYTTQMLHAGKWQEEFEKAGSIILLAFQQEELVGFAYLSTEDLPTQLQNKRLLQVKRIYILKKVQKMGVGKALMLQCQTIAQAQEYEGLWLIVWDKNQQAINFYQNFGFQIIGTTPFRVLEKVYEDLLMLHLFAR